MPPAPATSTRAPWSRASRCRFGAPRPRCPASSSSPPCESNCFYWMKHAFAVCKLSDSLSLSIDERSTRSTHDRSHPTAAPAELDPAERALYDAITSGPRARGPQHFPSPRADGSLRGPFDAFFSPPPSAAPCRRSVRRSATHTALDDRARELAILLVAARWRSAFERESHEAIAGRSDSRMPSSRRSARRMRPRSPGSEGVIARTVLALLDGDLDDEGGGAASASLGVAVVFELTTLVGYYATLACSCGSSASIEVYGFTR